MRYMLFEGGVSGSPDTPEWHAWRAAGIGGSDAPVLAAEAGLVEKAAWMKRPDALWQAKLGLAPPSPTNPAMERGRKYEGAAREAYEQATGIIVSPVFGEMDAAPFVRASFDGVDFDGGRVTEIKVPGKKNHDLAKQGRIPDYYRAQLAHQGLVAWGHPETWGDRTMDFVSYVPETGEIVIIESNRSNGKLGELASLAEKLLPLELQFWESVTTGIPPCGDPFLLAAQRWATIQDELEKVEARLKSAREALIALLGTAAHQEGGGVLVSRSTRKGSVDYEKFLTSRGIQPEELEPFRKKGSEVVTIKRAA